MERTELNELLLTVILKDIAVKLMEGVMTIGALPVRELLPRMEKNAASMKPDDPLKRKAEIIVALMHAALPLVDEWKKLESEINAICKADAEARR